MSDKPASRRIARLALPCAVGFGLIAALLLGLNAATFPSNAEPAAAPAAAQPVAFGDAPETSLAAFAPAGKSVIGDYVWYDASGDGDHFDAEAEYAAGIDGVLINLYEDFNRNGALDASELNTLTTTVTGDNPNTVEIERGWYSFNVTAEGRRYFVQVAPENFAPGGPLQGFVLTSDAAYPTIFTNTIYVALPGALEQNLDADFGFLAYADVAAQKSAAPDPALLGTTVTYTVRIFNNGAADATGVTITDALPAGLVSVTVAASQGSGCTSGDVFTCSLGALNVGAQAFVTVTGRAAVTGSLRNTATVGANQVDLNLLNNTSAATVTVVQPGIAIAKTPDFQYALSGAVVTFTIAVANTGDVRLNNVAISDTLAPGCARADLGPLAAGASASYTCTAAYTGDITNVASATGQPADTSGTPLPPNIPPPTASDPAAVDIVNPGINIVKTAGTAADGAIFYLNAPGGAVTYAYTVTNTGDTPLINVKTRVADDKCAPVAYVSGDTNNNNILETTETWRFTCTANITADTTNTATAIGAPATAAGVALPGIPDVNDTDQAVVDIVNPKIAIAKTPDLQYVGAGAVVTFTIYITNTGDVRLNNVSVSDAQAPNCAKANLGFLAPGASINYTCNMTPTATVANIAATTGAPADTSGVPMPGVPAPTAQDDAVVQVLTAGIDLVKTAGSAADGATLVINQPAPVNVTYTFRITNTGTSHLTNITVTDDKIGAICTIAGPLAPNASTTCTAAVLVSTDVTNTGAATGAPTDASGAPIRGLSNPTDTDQAKVEFRGRLGDFVWWDLDGDGVQGPGEPGLPDVALVLTFGSGLTATVRTDASGVYTFTGLPTGVYTVALGAAQFQPGGPLEDWYPTVPASGQITTALAAGQVITTADFGLNIPTSYALTKALNTEPPIRTGQAISYTIRVTNTGKTTVVSLPLVDIYDPTFLAYGLINPSACPPSHDTADDGRIDWPDLVASFGQPLAPNLSFSVIVTFTAIRDTNDQPGKTVTNTAEIHDAWAQALGLGAPTPPRIAMPTEQDQAGVKIDQPTGLAVANVRLAVRDWNTVVVAWDTANEAQILGFNIYRDDGRTPLRAVNPEMIAAEFAGANQGQRYSYTDRPPSAGRYNYTLEVVRLDGRTVRQPAGRVAIGE